MENENENEPVWTEERERDALARADKATPGPWRGDNRTIGAPEMYGLWEWFSADGAAHNAPADATFIAHARSDLPDAIAEIRRLRAEVARLDASDARWNPGRQPVGSGEVVYVAGGEERVLPAPSREGNQS